MYLPDLPALASALISLQNDGQVKSLMLFAADKNHPSADELTRVLLHNHKPLLGGIFPEIIAEGQRYDSGYVLSGLSCELDIVSIESKNNTLDFADIFEAKGHATEEVESVFCFVNALWPLKQNFMHNLYDHFGPFINYCGAGAGSLSFTSFPCVFANQAVLEHGAVLGLMKKPVQVGVAHGWHPISELIKVTETNGNKVVSLNWKPAFEVYKAEVEAHSNATITPDNFFSIAKSYPLGLVRLDAEMIIRDPFGTENNALLIIDEVPQGEYIRIMHGNMQSLLKGAGNALQQTEGETATTNILCIDCISRALFMQADFQEELNILNQNHELNGVLSIGEIANPENSALELYNKTVVVAQW